MPLFSLYLIRFLDPKDSNSYNKFVIKNLAEIMEVDMKDPRVAFYLFGENGFAVHWYGIIIAIGLALGVILGVLEAKRRGYRSEMVLDFMLLAIPLAIVCARLYYVIFAPETVHYNTLLDVIAVWNGGLAIYGGVIGGVIAALIFKWWRRVSIGEMLDIAAPSLIIAQGIGRWGNFVNQEAYGNIVTDPSMQWFPYAVQIEAKQNLWFQATFFYEFIWNVIVFAVLMLLRKKIKTKGGIFALYCIGYGIGRFAIESLRSDSLMVGGIRVSQLVSLALIVGGLLYLILMSRFKKEWPVYDGFYSTSWSPQQVEEYRANAKTIKAQSDLLRAEAKASEIRDKYEDQLEKVKKAESKAEKAKKKLDKAKLQVQKAEEKKNREAKKEPENDTRDDDSKEL